MFAFPRAALGAAALMLAFSGAASAQAKINIGCSPSAGCLPAMVALEEGIFAKHNLDVSITIIALGSTQPAALMSDSVQLAGSTPSVFLQAVDGGLDLVAVAGGTTITANTVDTIGVVVAPSSGLKEPKDFVGKKVGVPGLGAFLHVLFVKWLIDDGVDPKQVNFVEVTFGTMSDTLKSGAVDAVVTAEPTIQRIVSSGTGALGAYFMEKMPEGIVSTAFVATRAWAAANADTLKAFRAAVTEGAEIANTNPEKGNAAVSKYTKIPVEVLSSTKLLFADPKITEEQLAWWLGVMAEQNLLQSKPDTAALIVK
jgi:NitT/TauT family transport system substrate-binding protein